MDDARTRFPESHIILDGKPCQERLRVGAHATESYLRGRRAQKVVNLSVNVDGTLKIGDTANLSLNQVVAVNSCWDSSPIHPGRHELQDSHLDETNQQCFKL